MNSYQAKSETTGPERLTCEHCGARFLRGSHFVCKGELVTGQEVVTRKQ